LSEQGYAYDVVNASVSGDTTSAALTRLPSLLALHKPAVVVVEIGANDGLRGLNLDTAHDNIARMIALCRRRGAAVLLVGMQLPPNFGAAYTAQFKNMYQTLAHKTAVASVPFLLEGFTDDFELMQPDGIHPAATAQSRMLDTVWVRLQAMLTKHKRLSR